MPAAAFDPSLPQPPSLRVTRGTPRPSSQDVSRLDAIVLIGAVDRRTQLRSLPFARELLRSLARRPLDPGATRVVRLPGPTATVCVFAAIKPEASMFARLQIAGRLVRELGEPAPRRIGVASVDHGPGSAERNVEAMVAALWARAYRLPQFKSKRARPSTPTAVRLFGGAGVDLERLAAEARASGLARWLTAMPANVLTPARYRREAARLARRHRWRMRFFGRRALERLGAGAFLAVMQAHDADGGIVQLSYRPARARGAPLIALVGKGVCFDTGGVNLKPHRSMLDMHTDMAGSAVVLAVLEALTQLQVPFAVDAWLALAENQIGPHAYKPQDVVRALNGTTIQVIHSDAEGRMLLADTLALAARAQPQLLLDYATLTGACVVALSERYAGVFTNRPELRPVIEQAGVASGERVWAFPMDDDFDSDLESSIADVRQCAVDGKGDHILAGRFLKRFVPDDVAWAHFDLAASQRSGGLGHVTTDITGFGVRYSLNLLLDGGLLAQLARQR
jgi:leucyl aminopeptidase